MMKGGKGYTVADIEALPEGEREFFQRVLLCGNVGGI